MISKKDGNYIQNKKIYFNGKNYPIYTHVHTHPSEAIKNIGLSSNDKILYTDHIQKPIHILYMKSLYTTAYSGNPKIYDSSKWIYRKINYKF